MQVKEKQYTEHRIMVNGLNIHYTDWGNTQLLHMFLAHGAWLHLPFEISITLWRLPPEAEERAITRPTANMTPRTTCKISGSSVGHDRQQAC